MTEIGTTPNPYNSSVSFVNTSQYVINTLSMSQSSWDLKNIGRLVVLILMFLTSIAGIVGNASVILTVFLNRRMLNPTTILVVNLAVADLSFIVFLVIGTVTVIYAFPSWAFANIWCKAMFYISHVNVSASVITLVLISVDRYLVVVYPIESRTIINKRNAYICVCLSWIISLPINIPVIFEYSQVGTYAISKCVDINIFYGNYVAALRFHACLFVFCFAIPLTVMCTLYVNVIKTLVCGVRPRGGQNTKSMRMKKRVTRMLLIVTVIFAVCCLPIHVYRLLMASGNDSPTRHTYMVMLSHLLITINSCANPIVYAFLSTNFRRSFRRTVLCKKRTSVFSSISSKEEVSTSRKRTTY
ncbi:allatostatin-A receptor-like [Mizuhopecten yessoensis]|nr:allatostatin-A receptor-like [Mizuhopecten yessoensis]